MSRRPNSYALYFVQHVFPSPIGGTARAPAGRPRSRQLRCHDGAVRQVNWKPSSPAICRVGWDSKITKAFLDYFSTSVSSNEQQVILIEYRVNDSTSIIASRDAGRWFGLDVRFRKRLAPEEPVAFRPSR